MRASCNLALAKLHATCKLGRMNKTLPDFITEIGDAEAARLFRSPMRTIQSWRRRERTPRPSQATMIIEASGGRVTYEGIYAQPADTAAASEGV